MAKTQTFGDKTKKKKGEEKIMVKVVKGYRSEEGSTKFLEQFVKVDSVDQLDKIDVKN